MINTKNWPQNVSLVYIVSINLKINNNLLDPIIIYSSESSSDISI